MYKAHMSVGHTRAELKRESKKMTFSSRQDRILSYYDKKQERKGRSGGREKLERWNATGRTKPNCARASDDETHERFYDPAPVLRDRCAHAKLLVIYEDSTPRKVIRTRDHGRFASPPKVGIDIFETDGKQLIRAFSSPFGKKTIYISISRIKNR